MNLSLHMRRKQSSKKHIESRAFVRARVASQMGCFFFFFFFQKQAQKTLRSERDTGRRVIIMIIMIMIINVNNSNNSITRKTKQLHFIL